MNVFTRSLDDNLASLVKQIDQKVTENKSQRFAGFVVLLTDDPDAAEEQLKGFASQHGIKNVPLTVYDGVAGPRNYKIAKDAEVTVNLWVGHKTKANHAYAKGEFNEERVGQVIADTAKILK